MKEIIIIILILLTVTIFLGYGAYSGMQNMLEDSNKRELQIKEFIQKCHAEGKRVEEVGNGITSTSRLVCNPI